MKLNRKQSGSERSKERGITLIDAIVYIAVLSISLTIAFTAYLRFDKQAARLRSVAADIANTNEAGERWRQDVRDASGKVVWDNKANALRIPQQNGTVAYIFSANTVVREANGRRVSLLKNVKHSAMRPAERQHVRAWRWEVELNPRGKNTKLQPLFQFEAVAPNHS